MKSVFRPAVVLALVFVLAGCGAWNSTKRFAKDSWDATRSVVDPNPEIDTTDYLFTNPNQEKLARLVTPVDGPLSRLVSYLEDRDTMPDGEWEDLLFVRFPWINRMFVTDDNGTILTQRPDIPLKRFSQPLTFEAVWRETFLKTAPDYPELGPELYVGTPYFKDVSFEGLIVIGFDPRTIIGFSPRPEELLIIHPGGGVWAEGDVDNQEALLAVPWAEIIQDTVQGQVQVGEKHYTWLARFIGDDYYIYATESVDPKAESGSWWLF